MSNPVGYFEIPVLNMERAIGFYTAVFGVEFESDVIDGYDMAFFPEDKEKSGISGALVKGDIYKPSKNGCLIYFNSLDIQQTLQKAIAAGGIVLYDVKSIGEFGFVAEFEDSEGNRIALHQPL